MVANTIEGLIAEKEGAALLILKEILDAKGAADAVKIKVADGQFSLVSSTITIDTPEELLKLSKAADDLGYKPDNIKFYAHGDYFSRSGDYGVAGQRVGNTIPYSSSGKPHPAYTGKETPSDPNPVSLYEAIDTLESLAKKGKDIPTDKLLIEASAGEMINAVALPVRIEIEGRMLRRGLGIEEEKSKPTPPRTWGEFASEVMGRSQRTSPSDYRGGSRS